MPPKRHSVEQIIAKLREMGKLTGEGMPTPMAAKKLGITPSFPPSTVPVVRVAPHQSSNQRGQMLFSVASIS